MNNKLPNETLNTQPNPIRLYSKKSPKVTKAYPNAIK